MTRSPRGGGCRNRALLELIVGAVVVAVAVFIFGGIVGLFIQMAVAGREDALNLGCGIAAFVIGSVLAWYLWRRLRAAQRHKQ